MNIHSSIISSMLLSHAAQHSMLFNPDAPPGELNEPGYHVKEVSHSRFSFHKDNHLAPWESAFEVPSNQPPHVIYPEFHHPSHANDLDFSTPLRAILNVAHDCPLDQLHEYFPAYLQTPELNPLGQHTNGAQQRLYNALTDFKSGNTEAFHYKTANTFLNNYQLVVSALAKIITQKYQLSDGLFFQAMPNIRINFPGQTGAPWHIDSENPVGTLNFILFITPAWGTNSIWINDDRNFAHCVDTRNIHDEYPVLEFDGINRRHGTFKNTTPFTRISLDFRAIDERRITELATHTSKRGIPFQPGHYYLKNPVK